MAKVTKATEQDVADLTGVLAATADVVDDEMEQFLADRQQNKRDRDTLDDRIRIINEDIAGWFFRQGKERYVSPMRLTAAITTRTTTSTDLDVLEAKLLAAGVAPGVIRAAIDEATTTTVSDPYVMVREPREPRAGSSGRRA